MVCGVFGFGFGCILMFCDIGGVGIIWVLRVLGF